MAGYWLSRVELLIVVAFKLNYRPQKRETIETADTVTVKRTDATGKASATISLGWIKVRLTPAVAPSKSSSQPQQVFLSSHGVETEIGHFLHPAENQPYSVKSAIFLTGRKRGRRPALAPLELPRRGTAWPHFKRATLAVDNASITAFIVATRTDRASLTKPLPQAD